MTDDFGRRLEAAIRDECTKTHVYDHTLWKVYQAVRSANAQDSAPALAAFERTTPSNEGAGVAGAGVDLVDRLCAAVSRAAVDSIDTPESAYDWGASDAKRALLSYIESLERDAERYRWLRDTPIWPNSILPRHIGQTWNDLIDAARKEGKP